MIPPRMGVRDGNGTQKLEVLMSLSNFIKNAAKSQYFRQLIVRVIEDAIVLFVGMAAIWSLCHVVNGVFRLLGVA